MKLIFSLLIVFSFNNLMAQVDFNKELKDTPETYLTHILTQWGVPKNKVLYISNQTTAKELEENLEKAMLSFVQNDKTTSADIIDGRKEIDPNACGLMLNNLDINNIKAHLKQGKIYNKVHFKKMYNGSTFKFNNELTSVLFYSKKLDSFIADYFVVIKELEKQGVDYFLICLDNEINTQLSDAYLNDNN